LCGWAENEVGLGGELTLSVRHPGLDPGPAFFLPNIEKDKAGPGQARGDE
jgi:hypothetical protein